MSKRKVINSIQILRGVAAVVVLVYHVSGFLRVNYSQVIFADFFRKGFAGVDLFFVISGFIISYTSKSYVGNPAKFNEYWRKRIIRIYPIYWIVLGGIQLLQIILSNYFKVTSFETYSNIGLWAHIKTYALLPKHVAIDPVTWTMSYEIYFYALFSIIILSKKLWFIPAVILGVTVHNSIFHPVFDPGEGFSYYNFVFSNYNYEFLMGILISHYFDKIRFSSYISILLISIAILIIYLWGDYVGDYDNFKRILIFGTAASLILVSSINIEKAGFLVAPSFFISVGSASYVLYLIHFPFLLILNRIPNMFGVTLDALQMSIYNYVVVVINILVAVFLHKKLELPLTSYLSKIFK